MALVIGDEPVISVLAGRARPRRKLTLSSKSHWPCVIQRSLAAIASARRTLQSWFPGPHRAIGRRTPLQAFNSRPKAFPTAYKIPPHYRVRHDCIDQAGVITIRYNSRLHHIGLSKRRRGTTAALEGQRR